uniref:Uncharacterized protein n=1 Tax=Rhabditophanes sp. KR3021 TaxID=114890 RepID=A0AC35TSA1_9BILA
MPNIFQLKTNELVSLLKVLKPDSTLITDDALITSGGFELNKKLRSQITEWLLINNFSTMIQFHKDPCTEAWVIPNKNDSISCGKYRVAQKVPLIIPDPILMESSLFNANCDIKRKIEPLNLIPLMWDKSNKIETRSATDRVLMQSLLKMTLLKSITPLLLIILFSPIGAITISKDDNEAKFIVKNCLAKIKLSGTLDKHYYKVIAEASNNGELDALSLIIRTKANKICSDNEVLMTNLFLDSLKNVKEFNAIYNTSYLNNLYRNFYGINHKALDCILFNKVNGEESKNLLANLNKRMQGDPNEEELRKFVNALYELKYPKEQHYNMIPSTNKQEKPMEQHIYEIQKVPTTSDYVVLRNKLIIQ